MFDLSWAQWVLIIVAAFCVGISKMGISGIMVFIIPILAATFGGKESTGLMLPILLIGDIFAVAYYRQHAEWKAIWRLLPWAAVGLATGVVVGNMLSDRQFKLVIAVSVLVCVGFLIYMEIKGGALKVPAKMWFYALAGIAGGFATMIGNAAGPIMSIYLLAMGYKKNSFLGTYTWFFLILNASKVPLQIFFWRNLTADNVLLSLFMIPAVALGALLGAVVVKRINEKLFRYLIIGMTTVAAIRLFF